jgi:hypothetical protein
VQKEVHFLVDTTRTADYAFHASSGVRKKTKDANVPIGNEDRMKCVRLLAEEVAPALREYGKELGLPDPYEQEPGMVRTFAGANRLPVVDRDLLPSLGLQF